MVIETAHAIRAQNKGKPMFKKLALMAIFALSLGTTVASFVRPAHAAIDSFMYFNDSNEYSFDIGEGS